MKQIVFFLIVCTGLYSCSSVPITGRSQLNLVSDEEVLTLSLQEYNDYIKTAKISTNKESTALVVKVGQKIANAVALYYQAIGNADAAKGYSWEFNLVEDSQVNAFCMPGGKIVVYTGILPVCRDETGLAVVLSHEVGHAMAKHSNERLSQQMVANAGSGVVGSLFNNSSETIKAISSVVYGLGSQGVMLKYSRNQELEADRMGLILMAIAGYDANAAVPFWQRMSANSSGGTIELLSTHPSDNTRISQIQKYIPEAMEYYNAIYGSGTQTPSTGTKTPTTTSNEWHF